MTLRKHVLATFGVILGCAALLAGLLGAEGILQRLQGHASRDGAAFLLVAFVEFASALLLIALALVCLYVATRAPRAYHHTSASTRHHQSVTL
jgi:hypothetical protein